MNKSKSVREKTENDIPLAAGKAFRKARFAAFRAGHVVLIVENGKLIKQRLGDREEVLEIIGRVDPRSVKFKKGVKTAIKWADHPV